jgi:hypothetical protein
VAVTASLSGIGGSQSGEESNSKLHHLGNGTLLCCWLIGCLGVGFLGDWTVTIRFLPGIDACKET